MYQTNTNSDQRLYTDLSMQDALNEQNSENPVSPVDNNAIFEVLRDANSILINPAFRADWFRILLMFTMLGLVSVIGYSFPATFIRIPLFSLTGIEIGFVFPALLIFPAIVLLFIIHRRLDTRYIVGKDRLIHATGLGSFKRRTREMHFSYVRGILVDQTLAGRLFNFGTIRIGPFVDIESDILIEGVRNPYQYKSLLERRLHALTEPQSEGTHADQ